MRDLLRRYLRSERSQSLSEFALIAPVLLLLIFGTVDFGRGLYYYITLNQAVNEGVRVAVRASNYIDPNGVRHNWPSDQDVLGAVSAHAPAISLTNHCPNGPIDSTQAPPQNQGWIYITDGASSNGTGPRNAPAGGWDGTSSPYTPPAGCLPLSPVSANYPLQVTIRYNFVPLTPLIQQVTANQIVLTAYATYRTEY